MLRVISVIIYLTYNEAIRGIAGQSLHYPSDGMNNRNLDRMATAQFSTTAAAMPLSNSEPHPQPLVFLLITTLHKNVDFTYFKIKI